MSETRARRVRRIFEEALDVDPAERRSFVDRASGGDTDLRDEVLALFEARRRSGEFLESGPPTDVLHGAVSSGTPDPAVGSTIGSYRLTGLIARGGMGVVYRAAQQNPNRVVALKLIPAASFRPELQKRFAVETSVLGRLQHPGIAQILEAGTAEIGGRRHPYFAMELVEGLPLTDHARRNDLPVPDRLRLMIRVCEAVQHAHQKGVLHRDLKPANILVDGSGQPKVLDFGIARATDVDTHHVTAMTSQGELLGTLAYMSPEQVRARPDEIDTRSDVYSLGVVLFEVLSGERPHVLEGKPLTEAIRLVAESEPRPLPALRGVGADLPVIVAKALAVDRERRYASPSALAEDLRRYLDHEPVLARPASTLYQLRKLVGRNRLASTFAAALAVAVVVSAIALGIKNRQIRHAMERASEEAATASEVSSFLEGLFRIADPNETRGDEITARELLDRGAERIESDLESQPSVQRRLLRTMGGAYAALGLQEQAIPLYERAVALAPEDATDERVVVLSRLAFAQWRAGRLDDALVTARRSLDEASTDAGAGADETVAVALQTVGLLFREQGEYPRARAALERVLDIRERLLGPDHLDAAHSLYHLAWTLHLAGDHDAALATYERVRPIYEREYGTDHARTAWCYNDEGLVLASLGRHDEAERLLTAAYDIRRRVLPQGHPDRIGSANSLASLHWSAGEYAESRGMYADLVEMNRVRFGEDHAETVVALANLAFADERLGNFDEAERGLREAIAIAERLSGTNSAAEIRARADLGFYLCRRERWTEGEALVRQAMAMLIDIAGPTSSQYASYLYQLATGLLADGRRLDVVHEMLGEYIAIREREPAPNPRQIGRARTHRGRLAILTDRLEDGCADLEIAVPLLSESVGERHAYFAEAAFWLASCRARLGRTGDAASMYDRSLASWAAVEGDDAAVVRFARACRLAEEGERDSAVELLRVLADEGFGSSLTGRYPHFEAFRDDPEVVALLEAVEG